MLKSSVLTRVRNDILPGTFVEVYFHGVVKMFVFFCCCCCFLYNTDGFDRKIESE